MKKILVIPKSLENLGEVLKTNIEGIKVKIATFNINLKFGLLLLAISLKYSINVNFVSSLGWKENNPKLNHAFAPLISLPKIKTKIKRIIDKK